MQAPTNIQMNYNLDEVQETFTFILFGKTYVFHQPTTDQFALMTNKDTTPEQANEIFDQLVTTATGEKSDFIEATKKMTVPHWRKFYEMIKVEIGGAEADKK